MAPYRTSATRKSVDPWQHALRVTAPVLALAPASFLAALREGMAAAGLHAVVTAGDSGALFDWLMRHVGLQGISDRAAYAFAEEHGHATWDVVNTGLASNPSCPRLRSHWHFAGCGYRKGAATCAEPGHQTRCPLPALPLRKGGLNVAAYSLALFIRDVCDGDLIRWIDGRLAEADPGPHAPNRGIRLRDAVLEPLQAIQGIGPKVWAMLLADLLLGADPAHERWVAAGASMVAIDSLVHAFLHRTGVLHRFRASHAYGPACVAPGGCRSIMEGLAEQIDARRFNPAFPAVFPRFVQAAIWSYCAGDGWNLCNGNRIDDRARCRQTTCPAYRDCDRLPLSGG